MTRPARTATRSALLGGATIVVALAFGCAVVAEFRSALNSDAAWILVMAGRVLDGARLYRDTLEINPPLVVWLNVPVVWLARRVHADPTTVLRVLVYGVIAASAIASVRLTRGSRWVAAAVLGVLLLLPLGAFGEREHLIVALLLPLVAVTADRTAGLAVSRRAAVAAGLSAALAIALKPHFIAVWLLLALARELASARRRPQAEDAAIVAVGMAYVLAVAVVTPDYFAVLQLFAPVYTTYGTRTVVQILAGSPPVWFAAGAFLIWAARRDARADLIALALAAACAGSLIAVLAQGKGWAYHFYPLTAFAMLLAIRAVATYRAVGPARERLAWIVAVTFGVAAMLPVVLRTVHVTRQRMGGVTYPRNREIRDLLDALGREAHARSIEVLSTDISPTFPLVQLAGLAARQRFPHLWVPTTVYRPRQHPDAPIAVHTPDHMGRAEQTAFDAVVHEFVMHMPDLLLVESRARNADRDGYPGGFDHLAYYAQDAAFRRALERYAPVDTLHGFVLLRLTRRP